MHCVLCATSLALIKIVAARVEIAIIAGEIAATDADAEAMTRREVVASEERPNSHAVYLPTLHEHRRLIAVAPAHSLNAFPDIECVAVRFDVDEFGCKL